MEPVVANLSTVVDYYNRLVIIVTISESCLWLSAFGARILVIPLATGFANGPAREIALDNVLRLVLVHAQVKLVLQVALDAQDRATDAEVADLDAPQVVVDAVRDAHLHVLLHVRDHAQVLVQVKHALLIVLDAQVIAREVVIQLVPLHALTTVLMDARVNAQVVKIPVLEVVVLNVLVAIHPAN